MAVSVITRSRVGFSTAIIAIVAIGGSELLLRTKISVRNEAVVCGAVAVVGVLIWIKGRFSEGRRAAEPRAAGNDPEVNPLAFLGHAKYWGSILVVSGGLLYLMCARAHRPPIAQSPPPPPKPAVVEAPPVAVRFPALKLSGVVENGAKSSAVINGTTLCLGEMIDGVRLRAVGREQVTVELAGQTKVLSLPR